MAITVDVTFAFHAIQYLFVKSSMACVMSMCYVYDGLDSCLAMKNNHCSASMRPPITPFPPAVARPLALAAIFAWDADEALPQRDVVLYDIMRHDTTSLRWDVCCCC